jgi:ATP-dependent exoDNAse (exonuclease V) alpha subunit
MQSEFKNTIIFLDESSLASTNMMWQLLKLQEKFGFRLVMTGDIKQLGAVEAGTPYEQMLDVIPYAKIQTIVRQKDELHKQAVIAASEGNINKTFNIHGKQIVETQDSGLLVNKSVALFTKMDTNQRENTLLVSPTRKLRDKINDKIRIELRKENTLQGKLEKFIALRQNMTTADLRFAPSFNRGDIVKFNTKYENGINRGDYLKVIKTNEITNSITMEKDGKQYIHKLKSGIKYDDKFEVFEDIKLKLQEGLKIKFTKNDKQLGLINSETAIIQKMEKDTITLKMEDGGVKTLPKSKLQHIDYGYCITVHASQGKTYANTIAAISDNKWLNSQKLWLVVLSRHKDRFLAIVENEKKLKFHLISNKGVEISAVEHAEKSTLNQGSKMKLQHNINKANIENSSSTGSAKANIQSGL